MSRYAKNGRGTIDEIAEGLLRGAAAREMRELMDGAVAPEDLTAWEIFAVLAILRGVKERMVAQQRQPAPVLALRK